MINDPSEHEHRSSDEAPSQDRVRKLQLFRSGPVQFGVFEDEVATIVQWREPTPLPHAPESVLGVVSIQGRMLTVVNPALLGSNETFPPDYSFRHLIALRGDEQLALGVSELDETIGYPNSDSERAPATNERFILEVLLRSGSETKILNLPELFPAVLQGRERRRRRF